MGRPAELEEIIQAVAKNHGVILDKSDPILILQTVINILIEKSEQSQAEQLRKFEETLHQSISVSSEENKNQIKQFLNNGLAQTGSLIREQAETEISTILSSVKRVMQGYEKQQQTVLKSMKLLTGVNLIAVAFTVITVVTLVIF